MKTQSKSICYLQITVLFLSILGPISTAVAGRSDIWFGMPNPPVFKQTPKDSPELPCSTIDLNPSPTLLNCWRNYIDDSNRTLYQNQLASRNIHTYYGCYQGLWKVQTPTKKITSGKTSSHCTEEHYACAQPILDSGEKLNEKLNFSRDIENVHKMADQAFTEFQSLQLLTKGARINSYSHSILHLAISQAIIVLAKSHLLLHAERALVSSRCSTSHLEPYFSSVEAINRETTKLLLFELIPKMEKESEFPLAELDIHSTDEFLRKLQVVEMAINPSTMATFHWEAACNRLHMLTSPEDENSASIDDHFKESSLEGLNVWCGQLSRSKGTKAKSRIFFSRAAESLNSSSFSNWARMTLTTE